MKFCYTYDNMERLLTATVERDGTGPVLLCGNTLDELSLSHDGNQLRRVTDQCAGLAYEGAMDYRGDVRAVVADDGTLEEVNHYYPYGMLHGPSAIAAGVQPCKYTGKELDREAGLDLYDFAARQLDPALGRTTTQNPMAEKYYSISPYAWCAGNPIKHIDLTGKESINGINMNEKNAKNVIPGLLNKYQNTNKIVVFSHGNETGTALVYSVKKWRVECLYILKITFLQPRVLKNTSSPLQKYGGQRKKQNTKVWLSCLIHVMWEDQMVLPRKCQRHFLE